MHPDSQSAPREATRPALRLLALVVGELHSPELWTLRQLATGPWALGVLHAQRTSDISQGRRLRCMLADGGFGRTLSRFLGSKVVGVLEERRQNRQLDRLFDMEYLQCWWNGSGIVPVEVPHLNHVEALTKIAGWQPDVVVRVSGGILRPKVFSLARLGTLNIHHGRAPLIRGMWSIPWGIVEGHHEWIGATIHLIDQGIDTGPILWRGAPQLAPGDTGVQLFFRTHLEAVEALVGLARQYAEGLAFDKWPVGREESSVYRSAPGLGAWLKYLLLGRGLWAPKIIERGIKC